LLPKEHKDIPLFTDLHAPSTEPQGFAPEQMVRCDECLRANPPTRIACLYCGAALPEGLVTNSKQKPALRPLEKWEQGYNSILIKPQVELSQEAVVEAADLLRLSPADLRRITESNGPLPLARTAVQEEAKLIQDTLTPLGLETLIVSDESLGLEATNTIRLRTVELLDGELVLHPTAGEGRTIPWPDITLIVLGRLFSTQVEVKERRRRGTERQILDASQTSSDEEVMDLYSREQNGGWRILSSNFDFSCLGDAKGFLAGENFAVLKDLICARSTNAERNSSYNNVRRSLELVWPAEQQTSSLGWRRERAGKYSTSEVATTTNEMQFTRYSRLIHLLNKKAAILATDYADSTDVG
jgi:hypothetical protein